MATKLIDIAAEGRQHVDRYELIAEIASGGMATVFLARLSGVGGFQRFVAVKRLHPHLANEKEFVEMFLDEARLAAGIHHPNVVPILEVGASERGYYIVMEYIEGDTLARLLARAATAGKRLPLPIGVRIVVDTLAGLHAAHELQDADGTPTGLVHRDVSPQNVLVGSDGVCRITDFGVARAATRLTATRVGQLKGKVAYMAPEQAMGQEDVDRRADVFAAGIVLWEVLACRRLFKAVNEAATLSRVISGDIVSPKDLNPEVDDRLVEVSMRALQRDVDGRFATAAEFADALERAASVAGVLATPREVAGYVQQVIGDEIEQQREAVRAWLARSEVSRVDDPGPPLGGVSSVSAVALDSSARGPSEATLTSGTSDVSAASSATPERGRKLWPLLAASVILLVAAGGYFAWPLINGTPEPKAAARPSPAPAADRTQAPAEPEGQESEGVLDPTALPVVSASTGPGGPAADATPAADRGGARKAAGAGDARPTAEAPAARPPGPSTRAGDPGDGTGDGEDDDSSAASAPKPVVPPAPRPPRPTPVRPAPKPKPSPDLSNPYK